MSKKVFNNITELVNELKNSIDDVLSDEVADEIRNAQIEHIEHDVYSVYKPKIYERRKADGGLSDPRNIKAYVKNNTLEVVNETTFNPGYGTDNKGAGLPSLVNTGDIKSGFFYDYFGSDKYLNARPFIENTRAELKNSNRLKNALKQGFKRRGIYAK